MSEDKLKTSAIASFNQFLSDRKLRRTPERYAILNKVLEMNCHFYIESLYKELEQDGYHVSRATVYNNIQLLLEAGIVRCHRFESQPAQYEKAIDTAVSNHHHLICLKCGKIKEVKDLSIVKALAERRYQSFSAEYFSLYVYGLCSKCQRRLKKEPAVRNGNYKQN